MRTNVWMMKSGLLAGLVACLCGCGEDDLVPGSSGCPAESEVGGECVGAPAAPVCDDEFCAASIRCVDIVEVRDDWALHAAILSALPGTCIAVAPGNYGDADLPGGVSLLGQSADSVSLSSVTLGTGEGAVLRGVTVGDGGVTLTGAKGAKIESVRVSGAMNDGIAVLAGSSLSLVTSTVAGAQRYGLLATEFTDVSIERSLLTANVGAGLWAECGSHGGDQCGCASRPTLSMRTSIARGNFLLGLGLIGVAASLRDVDIVDTTGDPGQFHRDGPGLAVADCSELDAKGVRVLRSNAYGVLIKESNASLGGAGEAEGVDISANTVGLWVRDIREPLKVSLDNGRIADNAGVGIGVSGDTRGFIICRSTVTRTTSAKLRVYENGVERLEPLEVGDGLAWLDGSQVQIDGLTVSASTRASILIDGEADGALQNIKLEGGDEEKGIIQQSFTGGAQPASGPGAPQITSTPVELFPVPIGPGGF